MVKKEKYKAVTGFLAKATALALVLIALAGCYAFYKAGKRRPFAAYEKARAFASRDEQEKAFRELDTAIRLKSDFPQAYALAGSLYLKKGELEKAIVSFQKALALLKGNFPSATLGLVEAYIKLERWNDAKREIEEALVLRPEFPEAIAMMGEFAEREGKRAEAIEYYKKAIKLNSKLAKAHFKLGILYLKEGKDGKAQKEYLALLDDGLEYLLQWQNEADALKK